MQCHASVKTDFDGTKWWGLLTVAVTQILACPFSASVRSAFMAMVTGHESISTMNQSPLSL
jgi:hypothetical protein